jgi:Asp-tRNA(Asn)/Glu-tRNA(Gln) amidotransferase A subunit family amidase
MLWAVFMAAYYGDRLEPFRDKMDPDVVGLIEAGRRVSAVEYKRLELVRTDLWRRLAAVLADHDALLCPTMATAPLPAAKVDAAELRAPVAERHPSPALTTVLNLVPQCPVVSVPVGAHRRAVDAGLPIGMQVVGRRWREDTVLRIARAVELGQARR